MIAERHAVSIVKFIYGWYIQQYRCKKSNLEISIPVLALKTKILSGSSY
jgi:hypothetical protein